MTVRKEEGKKEKQEVKEEKDPYFTHQMVEILSAASILYSAHYIISYHITSRKIHKEEYFNLFKCLLYIFPHTASRQVRCLALSLRFVEH